MTKDGTATTTAVQVGKFVYLFVFEATKNNKNLKCSTSY
jgi:hypothetical protein